MWRTSAWSSRRHPRKIVHMESERLSYTELGPGHLHIFHSLVQDDYIRRYLFDGQALPIEWSAETIRASQSLFDRRGVGVWLVNRKFTEELIGFCGFVDIASVHPEPQLVYAIFQRFTGMGYATEMACASIVEARKHEGFATIVASVDEVNAASLRILDKLGFMRIATLQGAFGNMFLLRLDGGLSS
jgi:ribosomal-protein-alanine N-acetyltransferase